MVKRAAARKAVWEIHENTNVGSHDTDVNCRTYPFSDKKPSLYLCILVSWRQGSYVCILFIYVRGWRIATNTGCPRCRPVERALPCEENTIAEQKHTHEGTAGVGYAHRSGVWAGKKWPLIYTPIWIPNGTSISVQMSELQLKELYVRHAHHTLFPVIDAWWYQNRGYFGRYCSVRHGSQKGFGFWVLSGLDIFCA